MTAPSGRNGLEEAQISEVGVAMLLPGAPGHAHEPI